MSIRVSQFLSSMTSGNVLSLSFPFYEMRWDKLLPRGVGQFHKAEVIRYPTHLGQSPDSSDGQSEWKHKTDGQSEWAPTASLKLSSD